MHPSRIQAAHDSRRPGALSAVDINVTFAALGLSAGLAGLSAGLEPETVAKDVGCNQQQITRHVPRCPRRQWQGSPKAGLG